jgi:hypothetical protein
MALAIWAQAVNGSNIYKGIVTIGYFVGFTEETISK